MPSDRTPQTHDFRRRILGLDPPRQSGLFNFPKFWVFGSQEFPVGASFARDVLAKMPKKPTIE